LAPEQVQGGQVTTASDIYAFGVVMFEMFTGLLPFAGNSPLATAAKRLTESPRSPRSLCPQLDLGWESVILRCLQREPAARFATAGDAVRSVGHPPTSSADVQSSRSASWSRTRRRAAASSLAVAAVLAIALGGYMSRHRGHSAEISGGEGPGPAKVIEQESPLPPAALLPLPTGSAGGAGAAGAETLTAQDVERSSPPAATARRTFRRSSNKGHAAIPTAASAEASSTRQSPGEPAPNTKKAVYSVPGASPQDEDSLIDPFTDK
jgi:serine/threonine protein kinase